eukprot:5733660-Alexandrium_andersonii.AAC.1
MEPLSDPRANGFATGSVRVVEKVARDRSEREQEVFDGCDQQRHGTRTGDASSPAAREACGPPAP